MSFLEPFKRKAILFVFRIIFALFQHDLNNWMNEWMNWWINEWRDEKMDEKVNRWRKRTRPKIKSKNDQENVQFRNECFFFKSSLYSQLRLLEKGLNLQIDQCVGYKNIILHNSRKYLEQWAFVYPLPNSYHWKISS